MQHLTSRIDRYTVIIMLVVVGIFATAWGLDARERYTHRDLQCTTAREWLTETAEVADQFTNSPRLANIQGWIDSASEINTPLPGNPLRWAIFDSAHFHMNERPGESTSGDRVLYSPEYASRIDRGAADLLEHCPEVESLLPQAFPMVFNREGGE